MMSLVRTTLTPMGVKNAKAQRGFTLVELAIVLVIIGLIIAAVLKGQELIKSSRLKATVGDVEEFRSSVTTFLDKYSALPGDFLDAQAVIGDPQGITWVTCDGVVGCNGNSIVDGTGLDAETLLFWQHLSAAGLVKGVDPAGAAVIGDSLPSSPVGGGLTVRNETVVNRAGHWFTLGTAAATPVGVIDSSQAEQLDTKADDGRPGTGDVRTVTAACTNLATIDATAEWNTTLTPGCVLKFGI